MVYNYNLHCIPDNDFLVNNRLNAKYFYILKMNVHKSLNIIFMPEILV